MRELNSCDQRVNNILILIGKYFSPGEKNITVALKIASEKLGVRVQTIEGGKREGLNKFINGGVVFKCLKCGGDGMRVIPLCPTCEASEKGKYKTQLKCALCNFEEKSIKYTVQWYNEFGFDYKSGTKKELGIKTLTDEGLK